MQADKEGVQSCDPSAVLLIRPQPAVNTLDLRTFVRKITLSRSMVAASDWICGITKLKVTVAADTKLFYVASILRASVFCLNAEWDCLIGQNYGLQATNYWNPDYYGSTLHIISSSQDAPLSDLFNFS